ncbi:MAG: iron-containing alcohol dehydrogenase [Salinisphaeraceae bacterium]|nr:iron-containing alcohol dehydrogenase [Salinisphaeraceae bacterium]
MIPFWLEKAFYRIWIFLLKIGTILLPFRNPELFEGPGSSKELCANLAKEGIDKVMIVTDEGLVKVGIVQGIQDALDANGVKYVLFDGVIPDPTIELIERGLQVLKDNDCKAILAIGGGSSIDAAKAIAARAKNPRKELVKMAGLFRVTWGMLPLYAIPTTAGTGSEVTIASVVSDPDNQRKFAIMDFRLMPHKAALDGELMTGLPAHITSATGMDALTHAVEAYISNNAYWKTNKLAIEATQLIMEYLPRAVANGSDLEARQKMAEASHKAGAAFTEAGVGYVHAIAHNFGAYYHIPHGLANAMVMPYVLDYSKPKCAKRLASLAEHCGMKTGNESDEELADKFIARIREMNDSFGIPRKVDKLQPGDIPAIADAAIKEARFTYAVPRYMDHATAEGLLRQMLPQ